VTPGSVSALHGWVRASLGRQRLPYLLLDSAQAENSHLTLQRWKVPYASLFEETHEASLPEIAPLLISLSGLAPAMLEKVCDWAEKLGYGAPCLSWMESPWPLPELARHLRQFHAVGLSDEQQMMLRWYDTRILPVWLACLEPLQREQFVAGLLSLQYINRFGDVAVLLDVDTAGAAPDVALMGSPLIHLDDAQYGMLVDAGDADTLISHLRRVITDETNDTPPRLLYEFVARYQQRALAAGIDDLDRQTQYLLLALYTSGAGIEHPDFIALMQDPPTSIESFYEAMQALSDDVWEAGPPLWGIQLEA